MKKDYNRNFIVDEDARNKVKQTLEKLSSAVVKTLGPNGSFAAINNGYGNVKITKDGVTVLKSLSSENQFENTILSLMKEVAESVNTKSGDGTTTCVLLTTSIILEGLRKTSLGYSAYKIGLGLNYLLKIILEQISKQSIEPSSQDLSNVATISANNDKILGELVYQAITQLGEISKHYLITVEESKSTETILDFTQGVKINAGYLSPYFVTQKNSTNKIELHNVSILIVNGKITEQEIIVKFMEWLNINGKAGLVICDEIEKSILGSMIINNYQKLVRIVAVRSPSSGNEKQELLDDISSLSGAIVYTKELYTDENIVFSADYLGECKKVIVEQSFTTFIGGRSDQKTIEKRAKELEAQINILHSNGKTSGMDYEKLCERLSMLRGGVAIIRVGGDTSAEVSEKKDRVLDAVSAAKAGKNGVLPGGGVILLRISEWLQNNISTIFNSEANKEELIIACQIVINAFKKPLYQILENSGKSEEFSSIRKLILEDQNWRIGYNAFKGEIEDLVTNGIVDATSTVEQVVKSSFDMSAMFINLFSIVANNKNNEGI